MIRSDSRIVQAGVRTVAPLAVVVGLYLFFAGHNRPGGGFASGLVLGAVVSLRALAGLSMPVKAATLLSVGGATIAAVGLAPLLAGREILDQAVLSWTVPVLGVVKSGSALVFDAGVTLVVVGLVSGVLDGLGADQLSTEPSDGGRQP